MTEYISCIRDDVKLVKAAPGDGGRLVELIKGLAAHENRPDDVTATAEDLEILLFDKKAASALFIDYNGETVGYAVYYYTVSTYSGKASIYIEDVYVKNEYRNKGIGKAVFISLGKLVSEENLAALEWSSLKDNYSALGFYDYLGGEIVDRWLKFKIGCDKIPELLNK